MILIKKLQYYKAKSDNTSIFQHNKDLHAILLQLNYIHNISTLQSTSILNSINAHDIGKTTNSFQNNITSTKRLIRHEVLSASYSNLSDIERLCVLLHHRDLEHLKRFIDNTHLDNELKQLRENLNIDTIDISSYLKQICRFNRKNRKTLSDIDTILHLGYLKLCDHTASANIKNIDMGLNTKQTFNFSSYRTTQQQVLDLREPQDIIIQAPTGSGKTETSLLWSDSVQNESKSKRIFYILPYIASINALYKRLKNEDMSIGVLHSKVRSLLSKEEDIQNEDEELDFFKKNIKQTTICTMFQLAKVMFQCKNFEMTLAQLKDSIIIVDEIHCFDIEQLTLLMETLKYLKEHLNVNICIMSASIPDSLLYQIQDVLGINKLIKATKEDYLIRHRVEYVNNTMDSQLNNIENDLINNKQVLVCVNNVDYSQELYQHFTYRFPNKKIKLIHGRFNAKDRVKNEEGIGKNDLLIGTQAIEVSLDIDYDVLYTEIAPFDSLLQRFGRVNRKGEKGISNVFIFKQRGYSVYESDIINDTKNVLLDIMKKEKGVIYEDKINKYLNAVYPEFNYEDYEDYKLRFDNIKDNLCIGYYNKNSTEEMIGASKSINVLPVSLVSEYREYKDNKRYIQANELTLNAPIYWGNFYYDDALDINISNFKYGDKIGLVKEVDVLIES